LRYNVRETAQPTRTQKNQGSMLDNELFYLLKEQKKHNNN